MIRRSPRPTLTGPPLPDTPLFHSGGEGQATALVSLTGLHDPAAVARVARLNGAALLDMQGASESLVVAYRGRVLRSEEHTSELQSLMRISYAVFCLKKKKQQHQNKEPNT